MPKATSTIAPPGPPPKLVAPGWTPAWSAKYKQYYYVNNKTETAQWYVLCFLFLIVEVVIARGEVDVLVGIRW
ncbi:hypothetical protein BCR33DRAFT_715931 [Rhizoclosmatium globosum]|uniref:WW domain-containing protein n=1 Tax=Rhizoclosmatium globosum TaxID=329046 RepID=A0A1Y2CFV0_9FUNG|nr:hypothetical protein BCR33DRAFT_715931 [Rhizoclosmatium globosum]|eukprot:ORY45902.1 hypothetical protein BCR33DRAFT_715931 [Rhizoclosmatium globosum]